MPTTVINLLQSQKLKLDGSIKWGNAFETDYFGIYIVSLSNDPNKNTNLLTTAEFNELKIQSWINTADEMTIDGEAPNIPKLISRLNEFWFPDETIVYIGKAEKQMVSDRVCQFYCHKVGKKSPHKGGFWIKLLLNLSELTVYYSKVEDVKTINTKEKSLLKYFMDNVSNESLKILRDKNLPLPFGNLNYSKNKNHGISKQYKIQVASRLKRN